MHHRLRQALEDQGYHILEGRGAFKACQWQHKSLLKEGYCYKQRFYGIQSHRCVQMTPIVDSCTHECSFCWRTLLSDVGVRPDHQDQETSPSPRSLLDAVMMANLRSLGGYNPEVDNRVDPIMYQEARNPRHVAISLAGEPTLYPQLSELIAEIARRGMTSFLVTNGTRPNILQEIVPPTQLYITIPAPNRDVYLKLCRPLIEDGWERLMQSQQLLQTMKCRTANRLTMVMNGNMIDPRAYAETILMGEPDFIEVKGYMFLGASTKRLTSSNVPSHREIRAFADKISSFTGYYVQDEQVESRVVLLSRDKTPDKLG
ncbi:MAG: 4-demethylwyosine synthase TYW1 [Candidatus Thorarchaeota archaeon]